MKMLADRAGKGVIERREPESDPAAAAVPRGRSLKGCPEATFGPMVQWQRIGTCLTVIDYLPVALRLTTAA